MAISFLQRNKGDFGASSSTLAVAFASGVTAGSIIVAAGSFGDTATTVSIADGKGDTQSVVLATFDDATIGARGWCRAFYAPTATAITITATYSGGTNPTFGDMVIWEIAGLTNATSDKAVHAPGTAATADSGTTGTLSASAEAAIGFGFTTAAMTAAGASWSNAQITTTTGSLGEERVLAATTAINGTAASGGTWNMMCCTFMSTAGGGSPLRRNSSLDGLGASGPFFSNPLARSVLGWRPSIVAVKRKLIVPSRPELRLAA